MQTKGNISSMQHKLQYSTGVAIQDNESPTWWYCTILAANTVSNTGKFDKMLHLDFLEKMVVGVPFTLI